MTEYQKWMSQQSESFKKEILKDENKIREKFIDENYRPISLEELKELDIKHNS